MIGNNLSEIKLSSDLKLLISLVFSVFLGISFISDNYVVYVLTSILSVFFIFFVILLKPYLFLSFYLSLSYPISLTIGKLGIDNLGILFLIVCSLLSLLLTIKRSDFSFNKDRAVLFMSFLPIIMVVILSSFYGFVRSGNDSLEILVKFFVFGVFPSLLVMFVPFRKDVLIQILDLTYYIVLTIFVGFSIGYFFFKLVNPSAFIKFFIEFDNPIGTSLFMMQFVLVSFLYLTVNETSKIRKTFIYITIFTALFVVVSAFQRSFLVAILFSFLYYVVFTYKVSWKMIFLLFLFVIISSTFFYNITTVIDKENIYKLQKTTELVEKLSENKDILRVKEADELGTIGYRIIKIIAAVKRIKERPYFGNGTGTFSNFAGYKYPHNIFIEFLYSSGFVGSFIVLFFLLKIMFTIHVNTQKIKDSIFKKIFKFSLPYYVLYITILQFSGGIMNIFPHLFMFLYMLLVLSKKTLKIDCNNNNFKV